MTDPARGLVEVLDPSMEILAWHFIRMNLGGCNAYLFICFVFCYRLRKERVTVKNNIKSRFSTFQPYFYALLLSVLTRSYRHLPSSSKTNSFGNASNHSLYIQNLGKLDVFQTRHFSACHCIILSLEDLRHIAGVMMYGMGNAYCLC